MGNGRKLVGKTTLSLDHPQRLEQEQQDQKKGQRGEGGGGGNISTKISLHLP